MIICFYPPALYCRPLLLVLFLLMLIHVVRRERHKNVSLFSLSDDAQLRACSHSRIGATPLPSESPRPYILHSHTANCGPSSCVCRKSHESAPSAAPVSGAPPRPYTRAAPASYTFVSRGHMQAVCVHTFMQPCGEPWLPPLACVESRTSPRRARPGWRCPAAERPRRSGFVYFRLKDPGAGRMRPSFAQPCGEPWLPPLRVSKDARDLFFCARRCWWAAPKWPA